VTVTATNACDVYGRFGKVRAASRLAAAAATPLPDVSRKRPAPPKITWLHDDDDDDAPLDPITPSV